MAFNRFLSPQFIDRLNALYRDEGSWWRKLVDDPEVFVGIRNDAINAYAGGGSVARVEWNGASIRLLVHIKYLVFPPSIPRNPYLDLFSKKKPPAPIMVTTDAEFARWLSQIKDAANSQSGKERQDENVIAAKNSCVIDIEASFNSREERDLAVMDDVSSGIGRMDLIVVNSDSCLRTFELKLFANRELRSRGGEPPAVCGQLLEYADWLRKYQDDALDAYSRVIEYFSALDGRFFEVRREFRLDGVDATPRLMITDFNAHQRKEALPKVRHEILKEVAKQKPLESFNRDCVKWVGNASEIKSSHLQ